MRHLCLLLGFVSMCAAAARAEELDKTTVSVPWTEFRDILTRITPDSAAATTRPSPPVDYALTGASYHIRRASEREFVVRAELDAVVLAKRAWVTLELGQAPGLLPPVTIDNRPAVTGTLPGGRWGVTVTGAGRHRLRYAFVVLMEEQAGKRVVRFPLPPHAASTVSIELERAGYVVSANGMVLAERKSASGAVYSGGLGSANSAAIEWLQEMSQVSVKNAMVLAHLNTLYGVGVGVLQVSAEVALSVFHQDIRSFTLTLPADLEVIDLAGPALAAWETADSAGTRFLHAYTKYSVRDKATFTLTAETQFSDSLSRLAFPPIGVHGATRQEGTVAVGVLGNVEISPVDNSANVLRRDKRELPSWFAGEEDILYVYQYLSAPYHIEVALTRHDNVPVLNAIGGTASLQSVVRDDGKTVTRMEMTVRNRGEQFLRLSWKRSWQLWSLYCNDKPARPALDSSAGELLVPLEKSNDQTAETRIKLVFLTRGKGFGLVGRKAFEYPSVNVPLQNVSGTLYLPGNVKPFLRRGQLRDELQEPPQEWFDVLLHPVRILDAFLSLGQLGYRDRVETHSFEAAPEEREAKLARKSVPQMAESTAPPAPPKRAARAMGGAGRDKGIGFGTGDEVQSLDALKTEDLSSMVEQRAEEAFVQSQAAAMETGLLSIAVDLPVEGTPHPLRCVMLGERVAPQYRFFYREAPEHRPAWAGWLEFVLTLAAGLALTWCLWRGYKRPLAVYGIIVPLAAILVVDRYLGCPLYLDLVYLVPLAWYVAMAVRSLAVRVRRSMDWWPELVKSVKALGKKKKAEGTAAPTAQAAKQDDGVGPPPLPGGKQ